MDPRLYRIRLPVMLGEVPLEFLPLVGRTMNDHLRTLVDAASLSLLSANPAGCLFNWKHPHNMFVKELLRCASFVCGRDQVKSEQFANDYLFLSTSASTATPTTTSSPIFSSLVVGCSLVLRLLATPFVLLCLLLAS